MSDTSSTELALTQDNMFERVKELGKAIQDGKLFLVNMQREDVSDYASGLFLRLHEEYDLGVWKMALGELSASSVQPTLQGGEDAYKILFFRMVYIFNGVLKELYNRNQIKTVLSKPVSVHEICAT